MKEEDIRPDEIFRTYLALAEKDAVTYFHGAVYRYVACPACGCEESSFAFRKMGFDYEECTSCRTLFANPRPSADAFQDYYQDAPSVRYWATNFYRETETSRRERIIRPKAELVAGYLERFAGSSAQGGAILDIGAGYGVFCEELSKLVSSDMRVVAVEPGPPLADICRKKGIPTVQKFFEEVTGSDVGNEQIIAATSFELLEHLWDPMEFIGHCRELLPRDALLILTSLTWDGFDLQVLRERSKSIHPPHHINFFTKTGVTRWLGDHGFQVMDLITPGQLDVDIVSKQVGDIQAPFIRSLVQGDDATRRLFQTFLRDAKLSSHMMVVAKRTGA